MPTSITTSDSATVVSVVFICSSCIIASGRRPPALYPFVPSGRSPSDSERGDKSKRPALPNPRSTSDHITLSAPVQFSKPLSLAGAIVLIEAAQQL